MNNRPQSSTIHLVGSPSFARGAGAGSTGRLAPAVACAAAIRAGTTPDAPVVVVGHGDPAPHPASLGLKASTRLSIPLHRPQLVKPGLRRAIGGADRVISWSDELAGLAVGMTDAVDLISTRPDRFRSSVRRLSSVSCYTDRDAAVWSSMGATPSLLSLTGLLAHEPNSAEPRANALSPMTRSREAIRAQLGLDPDHILFAALDDEPGHADARGMVFMLTILHETSFKVAGLAPIVAHNTVAARRHHRATGRQYPLLLTDRPPAEWLPAADFVILGPARGHAADDLVQDFAESYGAQTVRIGTGGKWSRSAGAAAESSTLIERLDAFMASHTPEPAHA